MCCVVRVWYVCDVCVCGLCMLCVFVYCGASDTVKCRQVCHEWAWWVDRQQQSFWKEMYQYHIGWNIDVSDEFDWKTTLMRIEHNLTAIDAVCTWSADRVKLMSPWKLSTNTSFYTDYWQIDFDLKTGVTRDLDATISSCGAHLNYVYDNAFEVKGVRMTCLRRQHMPACRMCMNRKTCNNPIYKFFIKKLAHPNVNDFLCQRVTQVHVDVVQGV